MKSFSVTPRNPAGADVDGADCAGEPNSVLHLYSGRYASLPIPVLEDGDLRFVYFIPNRDELPEDGDCSLTHRHLRTRVRVCFHGARLSVLLGSESDRRSF